MKRRVLFTSFVLFLFSFSLNLLDTNAQDINVNLAGPSNGRFWSDQDERVSFWGDPEKSFADSSNVKGAEKKNQIALGSHRWSKAG